MQLERLETEMSQRMQRFKGLQKLSLLGKKYENVTFENSEAWAFKRCQKYCENYKTVLFDIINERYNQGKPTVSSSNYSLNELVNLRGISEKTVDIISVWPVEQWWKSDVKVAEIQTKLKIYHFRRRVTQFKWQIS